MMSLTPNQLGCFNYICTFMAKNGYAPSVREIALGLGLTKTSQSIVHRILKRLVDRGYIRLLPRQARGIEIINYSIACPNCGHSISSAGFAPSTAERTAGGSTPPPAARAVGGTNSLERT